MIWEEGWTNFPFSIETLPSANVRAIITTSSMAFHSLLKLFPDDFALEDRKSSFPPFHSLLKLFEFALLLTDYDWTVWAFHSLLKLFKKN